MTNDVEKRWHDPQMFRTAVVFDLAVIALAALAFGFYVYDRSVIAAVLVPVILFVGGVVAFVNTYRVWRAEGTWPIWQGAGWFLLALSLLCLAVPGSAIHS